MFCSRILFVNDMDTEHHAATIRDGFPEHLTEDHLNIMKYN
jgi:hypothetical protein